MGFPNEAVKRVRKIRHSYDMAMASEREYERQRQNNHTKVIQNAIESVVGRGLGMIGNASFSSMRSDNFGLDNIGAPDLIPPRPIGPLEEMPLSSVISDSIRLQNVLKNTQVAAEHRLRVKTELNKRARRIVSATGEEVLFGNTIKNTKTEANIIDSVKNLNALETNAREASMKKAKRIVAETGEERIFSNQYNSAQHYTLEMNEPKFEFIIENLALPGDGKMRFPARISRYNESNGASWDGISYVNGIEDKYIYQRGDKSFDLEFSLFVAKDESTEEDIFAQENLCRQAFGLYLEFLNKINRPRLSSNNHIAAVPHCKLTLGQLIIAQLCIIESVNIAYNPDVWEYTPGKQAPLFANISLTGKYIFGSPNVETKFYGEAYE